MAISNDVLCRVITSMINTSIDNKWKYQKDKTRQT